MFAKKIVSIIHIRSLNIIIKKCPHKTENVNMNKDEIAEFESGAGKLVETGWYVRMEFEKSFNHFALVITIVLGLRTWLQVILCKDLHLDMYLFVSFYQWDIYLFFLFTQLMSTRNIHQ